MGMIAALDHILLEAVDLPAAVRAYETLLGRACDARDTDGGAARAWFRLSNLSLAIVAGTGTGLASMAFAVGDFDRARQLAGRRGLVSARPAATAGGDAQRLPLSETATHGVRLSLVARDLGIGGAERATAAADATLGGLDHVVIRSPNPERAVALYGGRLGLDLRLDRSNPDWGSRLLFFRCGDLVVEIAHALRDGVSDGPDTLWGLSWRAADIEAAHARLLAAGVAVSDIRPGRRPETRVFTVHDGTQGVPTLVIQVPPPRRQDLYS
jgi:catechol 2,3-dioxygenase-like lactoylglutathione lyase family enzyme